jgi:hypothetical protein
MRISHTSSRATPVIRKVAGGWTSIFADEARRQAEAVAKADSHSDDQDFVEAVSVQWDE